MVEGFFGTDALSVRTRALARATVLANGERAIERIDAVGYEPGAVRDVVEAVSLFGDPSAVYVFDTPSADEAFWAEVIEVAPALVASERAFVVIEGGLLAAQRKLLTDAGVLLVEVKGAAKPERFNTFALADALALRDKRRLWLLLHQARRAGITDEEIIGVLWWQLKTMRLAARFPSADAAGLKPYPYQKAAAALKKFTVAEVERCAHDLLALYHRGHHGECELDLALERWTLSM